MSALLEVSGLSMRFGGLVAVDGVDFVADTGSITALIGPNGAGKTTVFNCLTGFYRPSSGTLVLRGEHGPVRLDRLPAHRIARDAGVVRTFQNIRLFPHMSVLENLIVAQHARLMRASMWTVGGLLGFARYRSAEREAVALARGWLERIRLLDRADEDAGNLPYGAQRRLEIARAMCTGPRLLCLDEPAAGLNPAESSALADLLVEIRDRHATAVLLVEHDMSVVMRISDRVVVLDRGRKIADGPPDEVRHDEAVIRAYLGAEEDGAC